MIDGVSFPKRGKTTSIVPSEAPSVAPSAPVTENSPTLSLDSNFEGSSGAGKASSPPAMAGGAAFRPPPSIPGFGQLKKLSGQALSDLEIQRQIQVEHGWTPGERDFTYARKGMGPFFPR